MKPQKQRRCAYSNNGLVCLTRPLRQVREEMQTDAPQAWQRFRMVQVQVPVQATRIAPIPAIRRVTAGARAIRIERFPLSWCATILSVLLFPLDSSSFRSCLLHSSVIPIFFQRPYVCHLSPPLTLNYYFATTVYLVSERIASNDLVIQSRSKSRSLFDQLNLHTKSFDRTRNTLLVRRRAASVQRFRLSRPVQMST